MSGWVILAIGTVAVLYASVGHAGATGYIAVMTLAGLPPEVVRPTALVLNVCVATIATAQFARAGHFRRDLLAPLVTASVPAAFLGGMIGLRPVVFEALVGVVLAISAVRLAVRSLRPAEGEPVLRHAPPRAAMLAMLGGGIGLLSGLTGVGGGVFLTPVLLALSAAPIRDVAGVSAAFILANSLAGLAGRLGAGEGVPPVSLPIVIVAAVGGAVGSQLGAFRLPTRSLEGLMGLVVALAAIKLLAPFVTG